MNNMQQLQVQLDAIFGRKPSLVVARVERRRSEKEALAKARRLAAKHGINLERDQDGYWVTHSQFDDGEDDPRQGSHFCVGGLEVLEAVEAYATALSV
jgi:hypothetical protein